MAAAFLILEKSGDFYKLPFRKFRENILKIVGGNEGAMRTL